MQRLIRFTLPLLFTGILPVAAQPVPDAPGAFQVPIPSSEQVKDLEDKVARDPEDVRTRLSLIASYYASYFAKPGSPAAGQAAVQQTLWIIEHHPEYPGLGNMTPIQRSPGSATITQAWLNAENTHPAEIPVLINVASFIRTTDPARALDLLERAVQIDPGNRSAARTLGVEYAMAATRGSASVRARSALDTTNNATVLIAASRALKGFSRLPGATSDWSASADAYLDRARSIDPANPDLNITVPQRIRVGGNVQASNLIKKVTPTYPQDAKQAGIQGIVRFNAVIGKDGTISNLELVSGDPMLVEPSRQAVAQWQYKPTLLNGEPVEVITMIDVNYTLSQ